MTKDGKRLIDLLWHERDELHRKVKSLETERDNLRTLLEDERWKLQKMRDEKQPSKREEELAKELSNANLLCAGLNQEINNPRAAPRRRGEPLDLRDKVKALEAELACTNRAYDELTREN